MENKISNVSWYPIKPTEKGLIGFAALLFNDTLSLNSIAVYLKSDGGYRLVFPNKVLSNGKEIDIYYPTDNETYELIKTAIADKIKSITEKSSQNENCNK